MSIRTIRYLSFVRTPSHNHSRHEQEERGMLLLSTTDCQYTHHQTKLKYTMNEDPDSNITDLKSGPFGVLYKAVRNNTQVLVNVRNNHKLLGRVKAYDRHMNL